MNKYTRITAFVLTLALVLCSFGVPTGTVATTATSKWTVNNGSIVSETSETYIVDTVTVKFNASGSYIQHTEKLTELIGSDGKDGKGFINVIVDDGSPEVTRRNSYIFMQFLASNQIGEDILRDGVTDQGITWYIAGHDTTNGRIDNHAGNVAMDYGAYANFSKDGYKMAFTQKSDGKVYVRGIGNGVLNSATNYDSSAAQGVASSQTLAAIKGVGDETGEDGVYLRMRDYSGGCQFTITVAYPKPANYDYSTNHWRLSNGTILSNTIETWYLDTVTASYAGPDGYVQHNVRHTELIGKNGMDGKGWVNVIVDDGTKGSSATEKGYEAHGYNLLQLVADPTAPSLGGKSEGQAPYKANTTAMTWYLRTNTPDGGAGLYAESSKTNSYTMYTDNVDNLLGTGQRFVFTQNGDEKVQIRGNGVGVDDAFDGYTHTSNKKLSELVGQNGATGADGIYVRVENERNTATFPVTVSVFYKDEAQQPVEPKNLVHEDVFSGSASAALWFNNVPTDTTFYTIDNGEFVMRTPIVSNGNGWIQTNRSITLKHYTVSYDFAMIPKTAGSTELGGAGNLVGTGDQFYSLRFDADEANGKLQLRIIEWDSKELAQKEDNGFVLEGLDFSQKLWFNLKYEVMGDFVGIYLNDQPLYSTYLDGKLSSDSIQFFGFFAEGGTDGFEVKNFTITEGVEAYIKAAIPELKESITLHLQANVNSNTTEPVRMKITFKGEEIWTDGVQSGNQYTFSLPRVYPQDMSENISAELYIGDVRKDVIHTYSMRQYCMNQLSRTAAMDADLRTLLVAILNYGAEAQQYFKANVENLSTKDLSDVQKTYLSDYKINQAAGVVTEMVTGTPDGNYTWNAATLGLYDLIKVRFKFTVKDIANTRIKIGDVIYDEDDFIEAGGGKYYVYSAGIYATDFDEPITAMFIDAAGNPVGQQVEYSVNTYLKYVNGLQESPVKDIAQAIYNYGMASNAYADTTAPLVKGGTLYQLPDTDQICSYIIHTENNELMIFDGGYSRNLADIVTLAKEITGEEVPVVEAWFLSHAHNDHVEAFIALMDQEVPSLNVKKVYSCLPSREYVEKHNGLATYDKLIAALDKLPEGVSVTVRQGDVVTVDGLPVEVLLTPDETANVVQGGVAINESSVVFRLTIGGQRVLFLADIYHSSSSRLEAAYGDDLTADVVQMAHHGSQGAYFELYKRISPKACLWPTPQWLWDNDPGTGYDTGSWETIDLYEYMTDVCGVEHHYVAKDGLHKLDFPMSFE